jgi:dienelactone hydrolase
MLAKTLFVSFVFLGVSAGAKPLPQISSSEVAARLQMLQQQPATGQVKEDFYEESGGCDVYEVEIPVYDVNQKKTVIQTIYSYLPPDAKRAVPAVIIVPSILGAQMTEYQAAKSFCAGGIGAIVTDYFDHSNIHNLPDWDAHDRRLRFAVHALRTTVDWISTNPRFDKNHVGMMGLSMGAILTSLMMAVEPRLTAGLIVGGGGNLAAVMAHSEDSDISDLREMRMDYMKTEDVDAYEMTLRQHLLFDPLYFASRANPAAIHMVIVNGDTKVPEENQRELWQALGRPTFEESDSSHAMTMVQVTMFGMDSVIDFFKGRFGIH